MEPSVLHARPRRRRSCRHFLGRLNDGDLFPAEPSETETFDPRGSAWVKPRSRNSNIDRPAGRPPRWAAIEYRTPVLPIQLTSGSATMPPGLPPPRRGRAVVKHPPDGVIDDTEGLYNREVPPRPDHSLLNNSGFALLTPMAPVHSYATAHCWRCERGAVNRRRNVPLNSAVPVDDQQSA